MHQLQRLLNYHDEAEPEKSDEETSTSRGLLKAFKRSHAGVIPKEVGEIICQKGSDGRLARFGCGYSFCLFFFWFSENVSPMTKC